MTEARVTQVSVEELGDADAVARTTAVSIEVLGDKTTISALTTAVSSEILTDKSVVAYMSQMNVEVLTKLSMNRPHLYLVT